MPVTGARALLSAQCSCSGGRLLQQRVAQRQLLHLHRRLPRAVHYRQQQQQPPSATVRTFQTSARSLSQQQPDDSKTNPVENNKPDDKPRDENNKPAPAEGKEESSSGDATGSSAPIATDNKNGDSAPSQGPDAYKESLRSLGYGSARGRASRARVEEVPPLYLPPWFVSNQVSLYEQRPIASPMNVLPVLKEEDREAILDLLTSKLDKASLTQQEVDGWKVMLEGWEPQVESDEGSRLRSHGIPEKAGSLLTRVEALHNAAFLSALVLVHQEDMDPEHVKLLHEYHASRSQDLVRLSWWSDKPLSVEAQQWLASIRPDAKQDSGDIHGSPLANWSSTEYPIAVELLTAIRAELEAEPPKGKRTNLQRPVNVLSVLNRKGRMVPISIIDDIATDLKADVVHLDAASIANIIGEHLGQNVHWSRGSVSMLGYAAAEMNGRIPSRADAGESDHEFGISVTLPGRLRSFLSRDGIGSRSVDGRWEELKLVQALESLVGAADAARAAISIGSDSQPKERDLIIHLHDYVELSSLQEGLITKLRVIIDNMWQRGRRVVLVGSSAADMQKSTQIRDQLVELGRDGHHILPFYSSTETFWEDGWDNFEENIRNIKNMLQSKLGSSAVITFDDPLRFENTSGEVEVRYPGLYQVLREHVYDVQWVYRLTSLLLGSRSPRFQKFGMGHLAYALEFMMDRNKQWSSIYPGISPPYFSPLYTGSKGGSGSMPSFMSGSSSEDWPSNMTSSGGVNSNKEYDQHEKKLLSGLINAKDIHTTFNDIIVPQETKESLIGLTSLSLVRPDAFSYGVLKTERIPGCLLYGPPGTGKTLLAKAVAKESGANMLEVSAASINDMWLGQSEKNVRALFSLARKMAPMVIFLDEADALLGARHNGPGRTGHRETITQFLREWDGLSDMRAFIMVATNRPFDLDEAVLRRLPRKILVDLPLAAEREKILGVMLREEQLAEDVDLKQLALEQTELYSGSDLKNLCVSAAMEAVREECRAKEAHTGEEPYVFPEKRILARRHFDKGLKEISASISEDMDSLKAIRKFDEQYGDSGRKRRTKRGLGFEVTKERTGSGEARVRQVVG